MHCATNFARCLGTTIGYAHTSSVSRRRFPAWEQSFSAGFPVWEQSLKTAAANESRTLGSRGIFGLAFPPLKEPQASWAMTMLAAVRPELFGPI